MSDPIATRSDLARAVHEKLQVTKRDSALAVDAVFDAVLSALAEGQEVRIAGFGVFSVKKQKPRQGRNPKTGASVAIPAKNVVLFRPSSLVKSRVQK
jgi:nucleoid DNA-binding protein